MALLKCFECAGNVSSTALTCPHCGALATESLTKKEKLPLNNLQQATVSTPKKSKHTKMWIFFWFVLIVFVIPLSMSDKTATTKSVPDTYTPLLQRVPTKAEIAALPKEPGASGSENVKTPIVKKHLEAESWQQSIFEEQAKDAVRDKLKDPDSAKFKDVYFFVGSDNFKMVCGQVNSKNAMGGFTGFEYFISNGLPQTTYLQSEIQDFETAWNRYCTK